MQELLFVRKMYWKCFKTSLSVRLYAIVKCIYSYIEFLNVLKWKHLACPFVFIFLHILRLLKILGPARIMTDIFSCTKEQAHLSNYNSYVLTSYIQWLEISDINQLGLRWQLKIHSCKKLHPCERPTVSPKEKWPL